MLMENQKELLCPQNNSEASQQNLVSEISLTAEVDGGLVLKLNFGFDGHRQLQIIKGSF